MNNDIKKTNNGYQRNKQWISKKQYNGYQKNNIMDIKKTI